MQSSLPAAAKPATLPSSHGANGIMQPSRHSDSRIVKKLAPHAPGSKQLAERYGDALVCVRYWIDESARRRYTTVELVVAERALPIQASPEVLVRIAYGETDLRKQVKAAGGRWDSRLKLWRLPGAQAKSLGLQQRIVNSDQGDA